MAVTRDSMGLTEEAKVERQETDEILADPATMAAIREGEADLGLNRRADFPIGSYVRTRSPLIDNDFNPGIEIDPEKAPRPLDFGQVREGNPEGEFVAVRWSQAGCGCGEPTLENPAELVEATEGEYLAFLAGYGVGYNNGYDDKVG